MAYRLKHERPNIYIIEPSSFLATVSHRDLVAALVELSDVARIMSVVRHWDLWNTRYLVVVERK